ncbi:FRG domain-containing protein [Sphingosinicella terrae]|uniref:FRG domain-containing protein n=1 Tax=Sphingosinicella terrae TaxID=2172047 RepID=UPI000E0D55CE|nr:FRG domain-containing protein [Sphingosinicella terrae]
MDIIGEQKIWTYGGGEDHALPRRCSAVRRSEGHQVADFMDLATKVAELQFLNRDYVLLFRGQTGDHKNRSRNTSLKPSIMRSRSQGKVPTVESLRNRYDFLRRAEVELVSAYARHNLPGAERLRRQQILRWSILQHYEICPTPLLDVTHSLRIAASFATMNADLDAYIFVIGVPHISGAVTASAEAGLQIVRLASVCPPAAVRPHIQEGYLLGEYPELISTDQKEHYRHYEIDFGRRLIAKFRFHPSGFWSRSTAFPVVPEAALYPSEVEDPLQKLARQVKEGIGPATS